MQEVSKTKRIEWVDALKGYAICMMMFSHMEFAPDAVKDFIEGQATVVQAQTKWIDFKYESLFQQLYK